MVDQYFSVLCRVEFGDFKSSAQLMSFFLMFESSCVVDWDQLSLFVTGWIRKQYVIQCFCLWDPSVFILYFVMLYKQFLSSPLCIVWFVIFLCFYGSFWIFYYVRRKGLMAVMKFLFCWYIDDLTHCYKMVVYNFIYSNLAVFLLLLLCKISFYLKWIKWEFPRYNIIADR